MTAKERIRRRLLDGDLANLFIDELGWDKTPADHVRLERDSRNYDFVAIAEKRGFRIFTCRLSDRMPFPNAAVRRWLEQRLSRYAYEHVVVFQRPVEQQQLWLWATKDAGRPKLVRTFRLFKGQTGESLVQKLAAIAFTLAEERGVTTADVARKATTAFNFEEVTRSFFEAFKNQHSEFLKSLSGIRRGTDKEWYASIILNRLMFIYFIQRKGFLGADSDYLRNRFEAHLKAGRNGGSFYRSFLIKLCHDGLGSTHRTPELEQLLGAVRYVNGGLFEVHRLEMIYPDIDIADKAFRDVFAFFDRYNWHLDVRPNMADMEINPDVLGYIFEQFVNQRQMGAYYTKEDVSQYIVFNSIIPALIRRLAQRTHRTSAASSALSDLIAEAPERYMEDEKGIAPSEWAQMSQSQWDALDIAEQVTLPSFNGVQLLVDLIEETPSVDVTLMVYDSLRDLKILDPTCGSGAFLFAALNVLFELYDACLEKMQSAKLGSIGPLTASQAGAVETILHAVDSHANRDYFVLKSAIVNNLFGVDIMEEAVEICKLRLFLKLVAQVDDVSQLEPLPDIDFNVRAGNTLVGFATFDEVEEAARAQHRLSLIFGDQIEEIKTLARRCAEEFTAFQAAQASNVGGNETGAAKTALSEHSDLLGEKLNEFLYESSHSRKPIESWVRDTVPFHWISAFYGIVMTGGFDVIIGNPPFVDYSKVVSQYRVQGYRTEKSGNLYAFVLERALRLLKADGQLGIIVPLSVTFSRDFVTLRKLLVEQPGLLRFSNFDNIPDKLFTGVKESDNTSKANQQRITILLLDRAVSERRVMSTFLLRWRTRERERLFRELHYVDVTAIANETQLPKIGSVKLLEFFNAWESCSETLGGRLVIDGAKRLIVPRTAGYFIAAYPSELDRTKQMVLEVETALDWDTLFIVINSNVFFWRWRVLGDGFDVTTSIIRQCPLPRCDAKEIRRLASKLRGAVKECVVFKPYRGIPVPNINFNKRIDILAEIDRFLIDAILPGSDLVPEDFMLSKSNSCFELDVPLSNR